VPRQKTRFSQRIVFACYDVIVINSTPLCVTEISPAYWRATFDNPPINVFDANVLISLRNLLDRVEASTELKVVVFDSADDEYFVAHFDMTGEATQVARSIGPSGLPGMLDIVARLAKAPVLSIAQIRGRARGAGSEFALACDIRFASREKALLGQPEVGAGVVPGGGGAEWLPRLVGRARALEIILGSDDFDADTAERYGYVNRTVPDADLDDFVDAFARRIASFDRNPLAAAKELVNRAGVANEQHLLAAQVVFGQTLAWPETQARLASLFQRGLQQRGELEHDFGRLLSDFDSSPRGGLTSE
jgi:enoyl-CoA hydratase/carnithine racemase